MIGIAQNEQKFFIFIVVPILKLKNIKEKDNLIIVFCEGKVWPSYISFAQ